MNTIPSETAEPMPEKIALVAAAFGHAPEIIVLDRQRKFLH